MKNMPNTYFLLFELVIYIQFALCLRHAWMHRPANLLRLFFGAAFGVLLELATIRQLNAYTYGRFLVMALDVPLCIGVAWGCIIYSVMEFSDASDIPAWARPVLDGLLALNIDLALDAVAIRLGFWDWGRGLDFQYFGVPYANFWAWFWVVTSFSFGYRLLARRADWVRAWLSAPLGLLVGLAGVLGTNFLISFIIPFAYHGLTTALAMAAPLLFMFLLKPRFNLRPVPSLVFWVPFLSHAYLLLAGLVSGVIFQPPILLFVSLLMLGIALFLHRSSIREIFPRNSV
ncbi:MAG: carotenoid biosynthesis protein [Chloroflexi bacterium]|nr:carotenoid biosynthesis protein [Chloroflexota bacterium]